MFLEDGKIISHEKVGKSQYLMEIYSPQVAEKAAPGQFVNIYCAPNNTTDPFLRRPISIHKINRSKQSLLLYYLVVGRGTRLLSQKKVQENVSIMGPLGRGFDLETKQERAILIGGGIGAAPLLALAEHLHNHKKEVISILGAADADGLARSKAFSPYGKVIEVTENGSTGNKGIVTEYISDYLKPEKTVIYACGPEGMLKAVAEIASKLEIPCQVSLEARMACGLGACLGCTCVEGANGGYPKVCKDGPVFWTNEVKL
jgi:dihydroorotate dehydrogenase electron transfer subunit